MQRPCAYYYLRVVFAGLRFDFGQTTLEGHSLAGEERFSVQWCKEDDSVWWVQFGLVPAAQLECHC